MLTAMGLVGAMSAFINNAAAVALFIPLCLAAARKTSISPSRVLIPLSYAAQFGGVCTLIGTSTNILVDAVARRSGLEGFGMFEFMPLGLVMVAAGTLYITTAGRWLLPDRGASGDGGGYGLQDHLSEVRVNEASLLVGEAVAGQTLFGEHEITVVGVIRDEERLWPLSRRLPRAREVRNRA